MNNFTSPFLKKLNERGLLAQATDLESLDKLASTETLIAYVGFDCTALSLHVGNLIPIMLLRHLQQTGHKPIILLGGGTTKIGDPTGKDESRKLLDQAQIDANKVSLKRAFEKFIQFGNGPTDAIMLDNDEWLSSLSYMNFLRDYGKYFSVNRMLTQDSVKIRLEREQNLSFLEFNYMIFQAYDFLELYKRHNCVLQMGGQDQWGNIIMGTDLVRRVTGKHAFGVTAPLMTLADGKKMGKTEKGAVWLNAEQLSPYDYWQFWRNAGDADVINLLKIYTEVPITEIEDYAKLEGAALNEAKIRLAHEATKMAHGEAEALKAKDTAAKVFESGSTGEGLPTVYVSKDRLNEGIQVIDLFVELGLVSSKGEARRLIKGGGAKLNNTPISDEQHKVTAADLKDGQIKLSSGKKNHGVVELG